ncbi:MAG: AAA family ATPase [Nitrospinae bacterium]|nr:AAA family ATPase [Nitrospinota bacterium]
MNAVDINSCYFEMGFREAPFSITPDTSYFYPGSRHMTALTHLQYGLATGSGGFTLLTGEVGLGKTLLCRQLLKNTPPGIRTAYIFNPTPTYVELLNAIYHDLTGERLKSSSYGEPLREIYKTLLALAARGEKVAVILDEAHRFTPKLLEGLRLLSNLETEKEKLIYLILVGQPELEKTLSLKELRPLAQRISVRYRLVPFTRRETMEYIRHRIKVAKSAGNFKFSMSAMLFVHNLSGGAPRRINQICDRAMLAAYSKGRKTAGSLAVIRAAREVTNSTE